MEFIRAFNRDSLRRAGYHRTQTPLGEYYQSAEWSQQLLKVDPVDEVRYDTIGICAICGEDYDKYRHSQKYCSPACRARVKLEYDREYDARPERVARRRERIDDVKTADDIAFATPDPYTNLMLAIAQSAQDAGDEEWLVENYDLYSSAILGRQMEDFNGKET